VSLEAGRQKPTRVKEMLDNNTILEIKNLDVAYGHAKALHAVSLSLKQGETSFVIGRNGAGKTTLLKTIIGLLKPLKGSVIYEGREISGSPPEKISLDGIRYVAQEKKVFGNLTVRENIELAAYGAGEPMERALDKVIGLYPKIRNFLKIKAGQLSGGQRQILLIGRALVGEPKLLLIDEPTEGLAASVIEDVTAILSRMKGHVSAMIVEQNLAFVNQLADRVYIMKEGKVEREIADRSAISDTREFEQYL
jgi:ABC-type branched-subunit amino acid transport system ATPase component